MTVGKRRTHERPVKMLQAAGIVAGEADNLVDEITKPTDVTTAPSKAA
jgi:hypothetical protein